MNMEKKNLPKIILILGVGVLIGYIISNATTLSVRELKTPSASYVGEDKDVAFANSLGLASFDGAWVVVSGGEMVNDVNSVAVDCWLDIKTKVVTLTEARKDNADKTMCVQSGEPMVLKLGQRGY